jgi:hypothetical protein
MKNKLFFLITLFSVSMFSQDYKVLPLNSTLLNKRVNINKYDKDYKKYLKTAYYAEKRLPENFIKNGTVDYTKNIQDAINENEIIVLPNFPVLVNIKGLKLRDNSVLLFQAKSKIIIEPNNLTNYEILNLNGVKNVKVYFPNIIGDKYKHLASTGEWGFGISIRGAKDVLIIEPKVYETWGDGIYIGKLGNECSERINVVNALINDVRRNGISITCGTDINILSPVLSNTNGNNPKSGLDIEPNTNDDIIENINILNPVTFNNEWSGILVVLQGLEGEINKKVNINIENHIDIKSKNAFSLQGLVQNKHKNFILEGNIRINETSYLKSKNEFYFYTSNLSSLKMESSNKTISDKIDSYKKNIKK